MRFGSTFASAGTSPFVSVRYSAKPSSLDPAKAGTISAAPAGGQVQASFPAVDDKPDQWFAGTLTQARELECVLVWDEHEQVSPARHPVPVQSKRSLVLRADNRPTSSSASTRRSSSPTTAPRAGPSTRTRPQPRHPPSRAPTTRRARTRSLCRPCRRSTCASLRATVRARCSARAAARAAPPAATSGAGLRSHARGRPKWRTLATSR